MANDYRRTVCAECEAEEIAGELIAERCQFTYMCGVDGHTFLVHPSEAKKLDAIVKQAVDNV